MTFLRGRPRRRGGRSISGCSATTLPRLRACGGMRTGLSSARPHRTTAVDAFTPISNHRPALATQVYPTHKGRPRPGSRPLFCRAVSFRLVRWPTCLIDIQLRLLPANQPAREPVGTRKTPFGHHPIHCRSREGDLPLHFSAKCVGFGRGVMFGCDGHDLKPSNHWRSVELLRVNENAVNQTR